MDRLVLAYAAKKIYPQTRLIIDFGTATTLDFLSKNGDYQGGFILPGVGSTLKVLSGCALLPTNIRFKRSRSFVPKTTLSSITRGLEEGFSAMINSLVKKSKQKLKLAAKDKVIITGKDIEKINQNKSYQSFQQKKWPGKIGYWMARNIKAFEAEAQTYLNTTQDIVKKYAELDEEGSPKIIPSPTGRKVQWLSDEDGEKANKELEDLASEEIEITNAKLITLKLTDAQIDDLALTLEEWKIADLFIRIQHLVP